MTENQSLQIRDTLKELHRKLGTEWVKEDRHALHKPACVLPFRYKVKKKIGTISKVQPERLLKHAKVENKMYNLLKKEQKEKYKESYRNTER